MTRRAVVRCQLGERLRPCEGGRNGRQKNGDPHTAGAETTDQAAACAACAAVESPAGSADRSRPYSLHAFAASTFVCVSKGRWPRSRRMTLIEFGQVELAWGKSFDHMRLSWPHHSRLRPQTESLKKQEKTWLRTYSPGSRVIGGGFSPRKRRK